MVQIEERRDSELYNKINILKTNNRYNNTKTTVKSTQNKVQAKQIKYELIR